MIALLRMLRLLQIAIVRSPVSLIVTNMLCLSLFLSSIRKGTKAPQAAGVIHTDFEKGK